MGGADRLEQPGRAAGEDGDAARALLGDPRLREHVADGLDIGAEPLLLLVGEVVEPFDLVARVGDERGDQAGAGGRDAELGWIEVHVDAQHAALVGLHLGELPEASQGGKCLGHEEGLPPTLPLALREVQHRLLAAAPSTHTMRFMHRAANGRSRLG